jgi:hypothetical protein
LAESFPDPKNFAEIVAKMAEDRFFTELVRRSGLTRKQVETLLLDVMSQRDGITMTSQQKAALRGVTKGAYTRTKQQALRNVQKALYTLLLLTYLGLLTLPSYQWFFKLSEALEERDWETVKEYLSELGV